MAKDNEKVDKFDDIPHERKEPRPNLNVPYKKSKLPASLTETLEDDEKYWRTTVLDGKYVGMILDDVDIFILTLRVVHRPQPTLTYVSPPTLLVSARSSSLHNATSPTHPT